MNKEEKNTQNAEVEIIGKAANPDAVVELTAEVERLKAENADLETKIAKERTSKATFENWWHEATKEAEDLRKLVKVLLPLAKLA